MFAANNDFHQKNVPCWDPKSTKNRPKSMPRRIRRPTWRAKWPKKHIFLEGKSLGQFLVDFGVPFGTPKWAQNGQNFVPDRPWRGKMSAKRLVLCTRPRKSLSGCSRDTLLGDISLSFWLIFLAGRRSATRFAFYTGPRKSLSGRWQHSAAPRLTDSPESPRT